MAEVAESGENKTVYELGYHLVPTLAETNVAQAVAHLKEAIENRGGIFLMEEYPTALALSYTIVKVRTGHREKFSSSHFGWVKFELLPHELAALKEELDQNAQILRYLLIATVKEDTRAPKRILAKSEGSSGTLSRPPRAPEKAVPVSEEELDRSIAGIVVE